jgi:hypothetical protein
MDAIFEPYFARRVEQIGSEGQAAFSRANEARVFSAVAQGYGSVPPGLIRPDAELLLQLAFSELLAQPLLAVRGSQVNMNDLSEAIAEDVRTITERALAEATRTRPISAHGIIDATSRSWSRLRTAGFQVWD